MKVEAAGLDRGTWHLMTGLPYLGRLAFGLRRPKNPVPGRDLAGTVVAVGSAVTRFAVGDAVFGIGSGSFAEYAVALEDKLARAPANLTASQAAAVPISGMTAIRALRDAGTSRAGPARPDHRCIGRRRNLRGAAGEGARSRRHRRVQHGQDRSGPIARRRPGHRLHPRRLRRRHRTLRPDPRHRWKLVTVTAASRAEPERDARHRRGRGRRDTHREWAANSGPLALSPFVRQRLTLLVPKEHHADLERLTEYIEAGTVTPSIDRTYPLDQAADAMQQLIAGQVRGKITITI